MILCKECGVAPALTRTPTKKWKSRFDTYCVTCKHIKNTKSLNKVGREKQKKNMRRWRLANPIKSLLMAAKDRAKRHG